MAERCYLQPPTLFTKENGSHSVPFNTFVKAREYELPHENCVEVIFNMRFLLLLKCEFLLFFRHNDVMHCKLNNVNMIRKDVYLSHHLKKTRTSQTRKKALICILKSEFSPLYQCINCKKKIDTEKPFYTWEASSYRATYTLSD